MRTIKPHILAPAGNVPSFLSGLAAGADALYCGLKHFSARMEADNFSLSELAALTSLARDRNTKVYIALNSLLKPLDLDKAARLLDRLNTTVRPDGIIVQDLGFLELADQVGFDGEIHLSTLANITFARPLPWIRSNLKVDRVILPRELTIDEIKTMASTCPDSLGLELFVHGALCYGVSGRCYWSSMLGGRSGLRGRCVQPCRRRYTQGKEAKRFFSCQDLSLDVLVKTLLPLPQIRAWKIEGRKKGPHYVYYTVKAYQMLRDHGTDPRAKRDATELLQRALGRKGTHYHFLPQKPYNPIAPDDETASGLFLGRLTGPGNALFLKPRIPLLPGDLLRVGFEDEPHHRVVKVRISVPAKGRFDVRGKNIPKGTPVYLIDRREPELVHSIKELEKELRDSAGKSPARSNASFKQGKEPADLTQPPVLLPVFRQLSKQKIKGDFGVWVHPSHPPQVPPFLSGKIWWWLSPVVWPENEETWQRAVNVLLEQNSRNFVLNAPWQRTFFSETENLNLWAGPFCNIANHASVNRLYDMGFSGAMVSPELAGSDLLSLPASSPLPLGLVIKGLWPFCVSRILHQDCKTNLPFVSPRGEAGWVRKHEENYWVFPNWQLDLGEKKQELQQAGYRLFATLNEPVPKSINLKKRPGLWNWEHGLL